jgi:UDP-N-acetyl-D-mannosaminuronic acid dehydrogenase
MIKTVCVVGLGYMGLPTALLLAKEGCNVIGYDVNEKRVSQLQKGDLPFEEKGLAELYEAGKARFTPTTEITTAHHIDAYLIAVPTPFTPDKKCDLHYVESAVKTVAKHLRKGNLVILESTVRPGTTMEVVKPLLEASGLKVGEDLSLAYVSEKAIPGNTLHEMVHNDRIVGVYDERTAELTTQLYSRFVQGKLHVTDCTTAETVKLVENTYRDVNIALANELADICSSKGMNAWEVIQLANKHPRVHVHAPGPGVGGHCIAVDPWFLVEKHEGALIKTARAINDNRPLRVVNFVSELIKTENISHARIALLGVAYKPDVDDPRESPALEIMHLLEQKHLHVKVHDPYVKGMSFPIETNLQTVLDTADIIIIATDHAVYKQNLQLLEGKTVVDTRNVGLRESYLLGRDF